MSTFKDITVSFTSLLKSRSRNPLYGTIVLIFTFRNYELIYKILFFNTDDKYDKLNCLNELFQHSNLIKEIIFSTSYAFTALLISYLLINFSKLIKGVFDNVINVWVEKLIDNLTNQSNTYSKDEYLHLEKEKNDFEKKFLVEKERRTKYENEIFSLENKIQKLSNPDNFNKKILDKIKNENLLDSFRKIVKIINSNQPLIITEKTTDSKVFELLINNRIIKRIEKDKEYFDFTNLKGEEFISYYNNWNDGPNYLMV